MPKIKNIWVSLSQIDGCGEANVTEKESEVENESFKDDRSVVFVCKKDIEDAEEDIDGRNESYGSLEI